MDKTETKSEFDEVIKNDKTSGSKFGSGSLATFGSKMIFINTKTHVITAQDSGSALFSKCLEEQLGPLWCNMNVNHSDYIMGIKYVKGTDMWEGGDDIQLFITGTS